MLKAVGLILVIAGVLALAYGGFSYISDTHTTTVGPVAVSVEDKETVNIPVWAGIGAIVVGGVMLLVGWNKKS